MKLNTKMVTRVTFRIYDPIFGSELETLLDKTKMTQQDFFTMLIREGYNDVYPRYMKEPNKKEEIPANEALLVLLDEIKDLIISTNTSEERKLSDIKVSNKDLFELASCIYHMALDQYELDTQLEIEDGKFDSIPFRFKKNRNVS